MRCFRWPAARMAGVGAIAFVVAAGLPVAATGQTQSPYSGTPVPVPSTFEAEDFDRGGEGVAYHDNVKGNAGGQYRASEDVDIVVSSDSAGGAYVVNNFETGEWLIYTINVQASAPYDIEIRASNSNWSPPPRFHVEIDGVDVTGSITVPSTGSWNAFQWVGKKGVPLAAGQHLLKIVADQQYFNLNSIRIAAAPAPTSTPAPFTGTPIPVPGAFEAEDFDRGGEGVAYHDNVKGNAGGRYRVSEDVDIVVSSDPLGGGYVVNNFETGEWLAYTINVAGTAGYDIELRVSSAYPTSAFHVKIDGVDVTGSITVPSTGSWSAFQWVGKKGVPLTAGQHVLKLVTEQQYFNLNSVRVMASAPAPIPSGPQITKDGTAVLLQDYASLPLSSRTTGGYPPAIDFSYQLGRANFLRSEPANAPLSSSRFFVNDQNRNLYILDKITRTFTPYINFEEIFPKFVNPDYAEGLGTFLFDPGYAANGKFYTLHVEDPNRSGSAVPTNSSSPGLDLSGGYTITPAVNPPAGTVSRHSILVEWTDTNRNNSTFEGTAREILRVGFNTTIHPIADLLFNPLAQPDDADYGNLYLSVGDGRAGELYGATHAIPQRLDALQGKILRITPDTTLRQGDELSENGRYRIPDLNPFVSLGLTGLRKEIYAYGFRNPNRMSWDPASNKLFVNDIGLNSWEEVNLVTKGSNYGFAEREGTEQLLITNDSNNGKTGSQTSPPTPFPDPDSLTVSGIDTPVTPVYPVAAYGHGDGDAISSGFVYRGSLMPQLHGKYLFGDITTARLFFADSADMIIKDDGDRTSLAAVHELQVVFDDPNDNPDLGPVDRRLFDVIAAEYARKGGNAPGSSVLPGGARVTSGNDPDGIPYGGGRADVRLALGGDGEIYVLSKSDGMIRQVAAVLSTPPPPISTPAPFTGTPIPVPGTFDAEDFDRGGEGVAYHDNVKGNAWGQYRASEDVDIIASSDPAGGGYAVNNFETGEWLIYTINVQAAAPYDIEIRASNSNWSPPPRFHIEIDGVDVTGSITVPSTGSWSAFQWVGKKGVSLAAGQYLLKIVADQQYFNLNSVRIAASST